MAKTTPFQDRFKALVANFSDGELQTILGRSYGTVARLKSGDTKSLRLGPGLRLAGKAGVSPYYLADEPEPAHDYDVEIDGIRFAVYAPLTGGGSIIEAQAARQKLAKAVRAAGFKVVERAGVSEITRPRPPGPYPEMEALGKAVGLLQAAAEQTVNQLERIEDRLVRLESAPAKRPSRRLKAAE